MAFLTILNNWKLIAIATASAAFAVLIAMFKYRGRKIKDLEHEVKVQGKEAEITKSQAEFKAVSLANEQDEILKEASANAEKDRDERVNSL